MKERVDAFGYDAEGFEDWWKESVNEMVIREKRRKSEAEMQASSAQRHSSRKFARRFPRDIEIGDWIPGSSNIKSAAQNFLQFSRSADRSIL